MQTNVHRISHAPKDIKQLNMKFSHNICIRERFITLGPTLEHDPRAHPPILEALIAFMLSNPGIENGVFADIQSLV